MCVCVNFFYQCSEYSSSNQVEMKKNNIKKVSVILLISSSLIMLGACRTPPRPPLPGKPYVKKPPIPKPGRLPRLPRLPGL